MAKKQTVIEVDGKKCAATFLGKGQYSRVYKCSDRAVMYTKGDCAKEVLAMYMHENNAHLPQLLRHDNITIRPGEYWYVFSSPIYRDVRKADVSAYKLMNKIIKCFNELYYKFWTMGYRGTDLMRMFVVGMDECGYFPHSIIKAMNLLVDNAYNCGYDKVIFDIHKKNFGVNEYGTLIFRDIVAVGESL